MELFIYCLGIVLSILFAYINSSYNNLFKRALWFYSAILILIVRLNPQADIINYNSAMSSSLLSFYYLREPVSWISMRLIYLITKSSYWTFVIIDLILFYVLFKSLRKFQIPSYGFFSILSFFPFILGFQNVYRQFIAVVLMLYVVSLIFSGSHKRWFFWILALGAHNVAGVFGLINFFNLKNRFAKFFYFLSLLGVPFVFFIASSSKSSAETGSDLSLIYVALQVFIFVSVIYASKFKITKQNSFQLILLFSFLWLSLISSIVLSSAISERISMFGLILFYPFVLKKIDECFTPVFLARLILIISGFVPLLFFGTRHFLFR